MSSSNTSMSLERLVFMLVSFVIVTVPVLVYAGFGIYFLVEDVDVCSTYSPLWIYGVVTFGFIVISVPVRYGLSKIDFGKPTREYFASIHPGIKADWFIWLPIWAAWVTYGGVIIYGGYVCSDMLTHGLWVWALVTFWLNVAFAALLLVGLCYVCCRKKTALPDGNDEERVGLRA